MRNYNVNSCIKSYIVTPEKIQVNIQNFNTPKKKQKNNRLEVLPEQKSYNEKCLKSKNAKPKIQIIDKTDRMAKTRTEQLALPKARQLSELKKQPAYKQFETGRKSQVNRSYRRSLLSLYSRLANVQPEKEPEQHPSEVYRETKPKLKRSLRRLSKPKKDFSIEIPKKPPPKLKGPYKLNTSSNKPSRKRLAQLSKPKIYTEIETNQWCLTKAMKYYKPTERLLNLSKPRPYVVNEFEANKIQPETLAYKATVRIKELATPQKVYTKALQEVEIDPFKISPKALKAVITKRVRELATPKDYSNPPINEDPFHVSKAALKAKITARLKKLAQPKTYKNV